MNELQYQALMTGIPSEHDYFTRIDKEKDTSYFMVAWIEFRRIYNFYPNMLNRKEVMDYLEIVNELKKKEKEGERN